MPLISSPRSIAPLSPPSTYRPPRVLHRPPGSDIAHVEKHCPRGPYPAGVFYQRTIPSRCYLPEDHTQQVFSSRGPSPAGVFFQRTIPSRCYLPEDHTQQVLSSRGPYPAGVFFQRTIPSRCFLPEDHTQQVLSSRRLPPPIGMTLVYLSWLNL